MPLVATTMFLSDMSAVNFARWLFEVGRRHCHEKGVGFGACRVYVAAEIDASYWELYIRQIGGIVSEPLEVVDAVVAAHVPYNRVAIL